MTFEESCKCSENRRRVPEVELKTDQDSSSSYSDCLVSIRNGGMVAFRFTFICKIWQRKAVERLEDEHGDLVLDSLADQPLAEDWCDMVSSRSIRDEAFSSILDGL